jgi:hypothetical protein
MRESEVWKILQQHVPEAALEYSFSLWKQKPFHLKITKSRQTKIGDFTSRHNSHHPRITLNKELNPYTFLITYLHEVAHLHVFLRYGNRVEPHGVHWKTSFQQVMEPVLIHEIFPEELLGILRKHMMNPKASSYADTELTKALRRFDEGSSSHLVLSDLPEGSMFHLHGKYFTKGKLKRTRILCKEVKSKKHYSVPADALVTNVQLSLL